MHIRLSFSFSVFGKLLLFKTLGCSSSVEPSRSLSSHTEALPEVGGLLEATLRAAGVAGRATCDVGGPTWVLAEISGAEAYS